MKQIENRPNMKKLDSYTYVVRTQAGFDKAIKAFILEMEEEPTVDVFGYPKTYPSVVTFSLEYEGYWYISTWCRHVNKERERLKKMLEILEGE